MGPHQQAKGFLANYSSPNPKPLDSPDGCPDGIGHRALTIIAKGVRNAYSGTGVEARSAAPSFAEAARLFWLALKEDLESDGWQENRLKPALSSSSRDYAAPWWMTLREASGRPTWTRPDPAVRNNHFKDFMF